MSLQQGKIRIYGSTQMPLNDTDITGSGISTSVKISFIDLTASQDNALSIVSSSGTDITQAIFATGRAADGVITASTGTLNGQTPVSLSASLERLLIANKGLTTEGVIALYETAATATGTAVDGGMASGIYDAYIQLAVASSGANDLYNGYVLRTTAGTAANQIAQVTDYVSVGNRVYVNTDWEIATPPDATTTYSIHKGMVFDRQPNEIMTVRRPFYNVSASAAEKNYYEKIFVRNNANTALLNAVIIESSEGASDADIKFDLSVSTTESGGTTNRITEPDGAIMLGAPTFDSANKNVPGTNLGTGLANREIGVWLNLNLPAGASPANINYVLQASGSTT